MLTSREGSGEQPLTFALLSSGSFPGRQMGPSWHAPTLPGTLGALSPHPLPAQPEERVCTQAEAPGSPRPWSPVQWSGLSRALQILGPPEPRLCPPPPRAPQSQRQGLIGYICMRLLLMSGFMHFNQCNGPAASHPVPRGHSTQVSGAAVGPGCGKGWGQVTGSSQLTLQGALRGGCPRLAGLVAWGCACPGIGPACLGARLAVVLPGCCPWCGI